MRGTLRRISLRVAGFPEREPLRAVPRWLRPGMERVFSTLRIPPQFRRQTWGTFGLLVNSLTLGVGASMRPAVPRRGDINPR